MLFVVACLILTGCMESKDAVMQLDDAFAKDMEEMVIRTNNYGRYADYYLPSDTQEQSADILSYSFSYGRSNIIMDINVSGIINSKYYKDYLIADEGFFDQGKLFYSREGTYLNSAKEEIPYFYHLYRHDDDYLGYFVSEEVIFYLYTNGEDLVPVSSRILLMAKGISISNDDIIANYSSKDVVDYHKKQVNLFETVMPVNGVVNDFLIGQESVTSRNF